MVLPLPVELASEESFLDEAVRRQNVLGPLVVVEHLDAQFLQR